MAKFTTLSSHTVVVSTNDIDTDQIIPARFLKTTDKTGLGQALFSDWRYDESGAPRQEFPLNAPRAQGAKILVAGDNFGCGSSREHAPWALTGFGFRAVVSTSFADIFRNNALKNGLLPVAIEAAAHAALLALLDDDPEVEVHIDLDAQVIRFPGADPVSFHIDAFAKKCLLQGVDELGYILGFADRIAEHERLREAT